MRVSLMKKLLSLILTMLLMFSIFPIGMFNVSAVSKYGDVYYGIENGEIYITQCDSMASGEVVIPATIEGCPVTRIKDGAFRRCYFLTGVSLPEGLKIIDLLAFQQCIKLQSIYIPSTVTYIGETAFDNCKSLETITVAEDNSVYSSDENGILFNKDKTLLLECPLGSKVDKYIVPNTVTTINGFAFAYCGNIKGVTIPDSVTEIGNRAFTGCTNLTDLTLPKNLKTIGEFAFCDNAFNKITIPNSVTEIGQGAFSACYELSDVWYKGTKDQKEKMIIGSYNDYLNNAKWHFDNCQGEHTFSNSCDEFCDLCDAKRTVTHSYITTTTKATLSKNGSIVKKCTKCGKVASNTVIYYPKTIKLSKSEYAYDGKTKTPSVTVKDSSGKTVSSKNYTVKYASGRKNVGKYKITIIFKGNYSGTKTLYLTIKPRAASVNKLTAKSKALTVKLNRSLKQSTGYQIEYSTSKKFKNSKTLTVKSYKTSTATIKKLKAKTTYYVRVRTYKTVGKTKYYSNWSSYKSKKTK